MTRKKQSSRASIATRRASPFAAGVLVAITGCSSAAPHPGAPRTAGFPAAQTPPDRTAPAAPSTAVPAAAPAAAPPAAASAAPAARVPAAPSQAEPLPPLTRPFVTVTLPGVSGALVGVHGRGPRDIWFLTDEEFDDGHYHISQGGLVHHDGNRVIKQHRPDCMGAQYSGILTDRDSVLLTGMNAYTRGVSQMTVSLTRKGQWVCGWGYSTTHVSPGELAWTAMCGSRGGSDCFLTRADGRAAPLPSHAFAADTEEAAPLGIGVLWMRGLDDGWMTSLGKEAWLFRYNGVTWAPQAALGNGVEALDMWVDEEEGYVWLLAHRASAEQKGEDMVLRFDGRALHALPLPPGFAASRVIGTGPRDVWFVGEGRAVYQWDGERLRQGQAPFAVSDAWAARGGEVWIVGAGSEATGKEARDGAGTAVAAHTAFRSEVR